MKTITIVYKGKEYAYPNSWEGLTPDTYLETVRLLQLIEQGRMSVGEARIRLFCKIAGWDLRRVHDEDTVSNLIVLSERLTFLFRIQYPDDNAALSTLTDEQYRQAVRREPDNIREPWALPLRQLDWHYQPDLCFFRQQLPTITVPDGSPSGKLTLCGYTATCHHQALDTSLTALQYVEALEAREQPTRLAAILYAPQPYNSSQAHALAADMRLDDLTLHAIAINFDALNTFLFTKTEFSLLTKFEDSQKTRTITTTMLDGIYDLCADGLGNSSEVEQLNLLTYLRLMRKKTIDGVRQLSSAGMDVAKIANETHLPPDIITSIL